MTRSEKRRTDLLEWLYNQRDGGRFTQFLPIESRPEFMRADEEERWNNQWAQIVAAWNDTLQDLEREGLIKVSMLARDFRLTAVTITGRGRAWVEDRWARQTAEHQARQHRRTDSALRARACRTALLRWLYDRHIARVPMPRLADFAQDDAAKWEGDRFTDVESEDAAKYLSDKRLISGVNVAEFEGPVQAEITTDGIDCVIDWEGNVAEYLRDQRGYGPTVNNSGQIVQMALGNLGNLGNLGDVVQYQYTNQQVAPGFEKLAEAVSAILEQLPAYGIADQDRQYVQDAAQEVLVEVRQPQSEPGKLHGAVAKLRGFLFPIAAAAVTEETRELAQKGLDQITSALGM